MVSTSQRARSGVPLDHRSIVATVPGVPAWGAVAIAVGATALGFVIDAARGSELTSAFSFLYVVGCVAAVLLVRYRGIFTAMVQAPLIMFIAVPLAYQYLTVDAGTSLRDILLNVAIPLVNRFPVMLIGTVLAVGIGLVRIFLKRQATHAPAVKSRFHTDSPRSRREKTPRSQRAAAQSTQTGRDRRQSPDSPERREPDRSSRQPSHLDGVRDDRRRERPRREPREPQRSRPSETPRREDTYRQDGYRDGYDQPVRAAAPRPEPRTPNAVPPPVREPRRPQPPREVADPYAVPRPATSSGNIPPHPVPQVRYRDRLD